MHQVASSRPKAVIFGCAGLRLSAEEKRFFARENPYGFILFARNCDSPAQVMALTQEMREIAGREKLPILIDQECERVARLKPPHWRKSPAAGLFSALAGSKNVENAQRAVYVNARLIAEELRALGITVNCAPLADIPVSGSHDIIGDRAYGAEPEQVIALAREMARGLMDGGVLPVLKHIPGHGRARVDSHESLPVVEESLDILRATDFKPFQALADMPIGMTAHILYTAIDPDAVATLSPKAIALIREEIGFKGILMSDDLSMKALKDDFAMLTRKALSAGCDLVLHCNGKMEEMEPIAAAAAPVGDAAWRCSELAFARLNVQGVFDVALAEAELNALVAQA